MADTLWTFCSVRHRQNFTQRQETKMINTQPSLSVSQLPFLLFESYRYSSFSACLSSWQQPCLLKQCISHDKQTQIHPVRSGLGHHNPVKLSITGQCMTKILVKRQTTRSIPSYIAVKLSITAHAQWIDIQLEFLIDRGLSVPTLLTN